MFLNIWITLRRPCSPVVALPTWASTQVSAPASPPPTSPPEIPRDRLPDLGLQADLAYELIHDHLILDGNAWLHLATFVGTWMEPEARRLMEECADKNIIDKDEYPQTAEVEVRCLRIIADLWNAPDPDQAVGTSTIGSSEACMLGGLVMKWHWHAAPGCRRRCQPAEPGEVQQHPNLLGQILRLF